MPRLEATAVLRCQWNVSTWKYNILRGRQQMYLLFLFIYYFVL